MSKIVEKLTGNELFEIESNINSNFFRFLEDFLKEKESNLLDAIMLQGKDLSDFVKREQNIGSIKTLRTILVTIKNEVKQRRENK